MADLNSPIISGDVSGGLHSTSVDKLKGSAVSATAPTNGQTLVWSGTAWTPATPSGGGGGGANGLTYYLNQGTNADAPTTNLPGTPKQLGRSADASQTTAASGTLTQQTWTQFAGFVTESTPQDPGTSDIPAGLWDFNVWLLGVADNNHSNSVRAKVFKYDGSAAPTLLATSEPVTIGTSSALVGFTLLVPETAMLVTDRIFVTLEAYATGNNHSVTGQFGGSTPSHVHTSLGLVAGTGLWKNVAGTLQSPASLLVDADVDANAAIASSKLATVQVAQGGTGVTTSSGANSLVLRDANANISANAVQEAFQTIVKSASTLTLTAASARQYRLSGSVAGQNINIPPVNTLQNGDVFYFINTGSTSVALNNSDGNNFHNLQGLASARVVIVDNADNAAGFQIVYQTPSNVPWSSSTLSFTGSISGATWAGSTVAVNRGGTGQTTFTNGQLLIGNTTGNTLSKATLTAGTNVTITNGPGTITINASGGSSGVSSFDGGTTGLTPETATTGAISLGGTLAIANGGTGATTRQNAMDALAGATTSGQYLRGNGTDVVMSAIQAADVPTLNQSTTGTADNVTGTVAVANGGTGQTSYTDGQILIGNTTGNTLAKATLTAGTNVTITNGPGSITIASTGGSATPTAVQTFINNGTWTKPAGARMVNIQLLGAGGGGGSGRKDSTSGTIRCGGGGGGGGSYVNITVPAAIFGATETVTIGVPGIGGAAQVSDFTNGTGGGPGTATSFGANIIAPGGTGGAGGTATTGTGGSGVLQGNSGASASQTGGTANTGVPSAVTSAAQPGGASGASGGGLGVSNTAVAGAAGGRGLIANLAGGLAGAVGGSATNGNANGFAINGLFATGSGGGSGGSSITASGGNGGTGGFPAAAGGGGGACGFASGFSGAGGSGAAGIAVITTYF